MAAVPGCSGGTAVEIAGGPRTVVFSDEDTCTGLLGIGQCGFVMCDLIPEGQTFAETCGPYFQEGVTSSNLDDAAIDRLLTIDLPLCASAGDIEDVAMEINLPDGGWLRLSGPPDWLESVRATTGTDCLA